ncbi:hypothetical protein DBR27_06385 [Flavobacterium sp. HMWF030]|nr:hypothetical protein DBR27_06385 [Flavobacterium sp. HMWF030]
MKIANFGNLAIIFSVIISAILGQYYPDCLGVTFVLGLFVMPVYQLLVGSVWFFSPNKDKRINLYFIGVITFFTVVFCTNSFHKTDNERIFEQILTILFQIVPITLAIYFTYILNQYSRE